MVVPWALPPYKTIYILILSDSYLYMWNELYKFLFLKQVRSFPFMISLLLP